MKNSKNLLILAALLLMIAVAWIAFSQMNPRGSQAGRDGDLQSRQARSGPAVGASAQNPGLGVAPEQAGGGARQSGTPEPLVEISGLGTLPYHEVTKSLNFNELLYRCGLITEGDYETRLKTGRKATADVYLNEKGEIIHICYQKGLYKTKSRDVEAMAYFRDDPRGGPMLEIDGFGIPGLTLDNSEMLEEFLRVSLIRSSSECDEYEVTPVMVDVIGGYQDHPMYRKYVGRRIPMVLRKRTSGMPGSDEYRVDYVDYEREDIVRREWCLTSFLPDLESEDGGGLEVSRGKVWDEPLLEAWERRQSEVIAQPGDQGSRQ